MYFNLPGKLSEWVQPRGIGQPAEIRKDVQKVFHELKLSHGHRL